MYYTSKKGQAQTQSRAKGQGTALYRTERRMGLIKAITWRETARGHQTLDMTYRSNVLAKGSIQLHTDKLDRLNTGVAQRAAETEHSVTSTPRGRRTKQNNEQKKKGMQKETNNQLNRRRGMNKRRGFFGCKRVLGKVFLRNFENLMVISSFCRAC